VNRLHLHLTDAGGWRLQILRYPQLTRKAAWRTQSDWDKWWIGKDRNYAEEGAAGAYGGYYTQKELRNLVAYADGRGITIVPEIEMPGHSEEILATFPDLGCPGAGNTGDFCPSGDEAFNFLRNVLDEVLDVFPSDFIHIGGDEANMTAWRNCERCKARMQELGTNNPNDLQAAFMSRIAQYINARGRKVIVWDEIVSDISEKAVLPAPGNAVMVWRNPSIARRSIALGYQVILCPNSHCYLDYYQDAPHTQPRAPGGLITLRRAYEFDPLAGLSAEEAGHVLGLQGNLWTEYVCTESHAEHMLWPRMLALAKTGLHGSRRPAYKTFLKTVKRETRRQQKAGMAPFDISRETGKRPACKKSAEHRAKGAKVTYLSPYSPYYTAGGEAALTDGLRGDWQHTDGRWQGFVGKNDTAYALDVIIDLEQPRRLSSVSLIFLHNSNDWIYLPSDFRISVATERDAFEEIYHRTAPRTTTAGPRYVPYEWKGRRDNVRYIRLQGRASARGEWLFTDEVEVR